MEHQAKEHPATPEQTAGRVRQERRKPAERKSPGQSISLATSVRAAENVEGADLPQAQIQHLQQTIGNRGVGHLLARSHQALELQRAPLTPEEREQNLQSPRYASNNKTLQNAYDNNPPLRQGASGDAVVLVQQGLIDSGIPLPLSTSNGTAPPDGVFGPETARGVHQFQGQYGFSQDGRVGRQTMGQAGVQASQINRLPALMREAFVLRPINSGKLRGFL